MIITAINGTSVAGTSDLQNELSYYRAGQDVKLTVQTADKNGEYTKKEITVNFGESPDLQSVGSRHTT